MSKDTAQHTTTPSALDRFNLAFEYDVTWSIAKKSVRLRTAAQ